MTLEIEALHGDFVARITGVDLRAGVSSDDFARMRDALDDYGVLLLPDQVLDDEQQIAFSSRWGPLEPTKGVNPASGTPFARQSNLDIRTGEVIPADDRRMAYQRGNYQWHADSTFKRVPSLCSILSAREVPPSGGNTEFVSTRAAYEALDAAEAARLDALVVEHDFSYSRARVGFHFTPQEAADYPPVRHPLVQTNPRTQRHSLLIGAHASRIVGWRDEEGRALLDDLLSRATIDEARYSHSWSAHDVVIWDNRQILHRATAYDSVRHRRLMQRTTIGNPGVLESTAYAAIRSEGAAVGASV